jgi:hypothetical protein
MVSAERVSQRFRSGRTARRRHELWTQISTVAGHAVGTDRTLLTARRAERIAEHRRQ